MEQLKKKVRIVSMTNEYLDDVAALERECFSNPWSRNMLAEELENACSAFLVALDAENGSVVGYAGLPRRGRGAAAGRVRALCRRQRPCVFDA